MGLGIHLRVEGGRGNFLKRRSTGELAKELGRFLAVEAQEAAPLLGPTLRLFQVQDGYELHVHPADEPVRLEVTGEQLVVSARTNGAGPGYHAFLVQCLERAAKRCDATLYSGGPESEFQDETGYLETRDFAALQGSMAHWLGAIADQLRDMQLEDVRISMPQDAPSLLDPGGVVTPTGVLTRAWVLEFADASEPRQRELAAGFFPWWDEGLTARTYLGLGLCLAWSSVAWHPAADEAEQGRMELALRAFEKARELGATVPEAEVQELRALLAMTPEEATPPREEGMGYLRRPVRWFLDDGWSLVLPGYWYCGPEGAGRWTGSFGERTVRTLTMHAGAGAVTGREALAQERPERDDRLAWLTRDDVHLYGVAEVTPEKDEQGEPLYVLTGRTVSGAALCVMTVTFVRREDLAWAEGVWRSLQHPAEQEA